MADTPGVPQTYSSVGSSAPDNSMGHRVTEPAHFMPNAAGGVSFIPQRAAETSMLSTRASLMRFAGDSPLRLLSYLVDIHPAFGLAVWNMLRLSLPPGDLQIIAVDTEGENAGEQNDEDTALINDLWAKQPKAFGGLQGIATTLLLSLALTGLPFLECVPGKSGEGLRRLFPVDSLTIRFQWQKVEDDGGEWDWLPVPYQMQRFPGASGAETIGNKSNWIPLLGERFLWQPLDALPDDPYGRAPFAPALAEILRDLALMQDLTDAIHNAAWPRLGFPFNFAEMYKVAKETYLIEDPAEAEKWVVAQFQATVKEANKLKPSNNVHFDSSDGGEVITIEGGKGLAALESILVYLRQRIVQATKSLPTLLGINDGSTQTYTTIEWAIYASGLENNRAIPINMLAGTADLHLRLLGRTSRAKAIVKPIRTNDEKVDAETEAIRIKNAERKRDNGWIDNDHAAQAITGTDAVAEPNYAALGVKSDAGSSVPMDSTTDPKAATEGAE